ncbi:MAG: hypothetical protein FJ225_12375 [Lentisphaerae bacterium]|nr:hypothetical protein [Lentisphaerota bacterium]
MSEQQQVVGERFGEAKPFPEMLSVITDPNLEVFKVTADPEVACSTRGGFFSPDGSRFFFKRQWTAGPMSGRVQYVMCEVNDGFALRGLTDDANPCIPILSRDGRHLYYFSNPAGEAARPGVVFKRVELRTCKSDVLTVFDAPVEGIGKRPANAMCGGSLRADGKMLCAGFNFRTANGEPHFAPVFINLETLAIRGFEWEPYDWRVGGTYFRGDDPAHLGHLLMGRSNRSQHWDKDGNYSEKWYSDVHRLQLFVVDESGARIGIFPIGGEGESVDHSYWRGGRYELVTHAGRFDTSPHWRGTIMCTAPVVCDPALWTSPRHIPGARRVELTRKFTRPDVCHMSWHRDGTHVVCDTEGWAGRGTPCLMGPAAFLYLGTVIENGTEDVSIKTKYLLHPRSSWNGAHTENCPELAPDLKTIFFTSDWTGAVGQPQVFAVRGFEFP